MGLTVVHKGLLLVSFAVRIQVGLIATFGWGQRQVIDTARRLCLCLFLAIVYVRREAA